MCYWRVPVYFCLLALSICAVLIDRYSGVGPVEKASQEQGSVWTKMQGQQQWLNGLTFTECLLCASNGCANSFQKRKSWGRDWRRRGWRILPVLWRSLDCILWGVECHYLFSIKKKKFILLLVKTTTLQLRIFKTMARQIILNSSLL